MAYVSRLLAIPSCFRTPYESHRLRHIVAARRQLTRQAFACRFFLRLRLLFLKSYRFFGIAPLALKYKSLFLSLYNSAKATFAESEESDDKTKKKRSLFWVNSRLSKPVTLDFHLAIPSCFRTPYESLHLCHIVAARRQLTRQANACRFFLSFVLPS